MPEKLMTLQELSEYLRMSKECIRRLVDGKVVSAYKIGGELLRFRKEQIDAIRAEIESKIGEADRLSVTEDRKKDRETLVSLRTQAEKNTSREWIADFFYFNDFYIVSGVLIVILLAVIFRG